MRPLSATLLFIAVLGAGLSGCAPEHSEETEAAAWPSEVRADFRVFAFRCSKCHSLARPLNSGIDDDEYWKRYVERMRRQPGSGISVADTVPILHFLHAYSVAERRKKTQAIDALVSPAPAPPLPSTKEMR